MKLVAAQDFFNTKAFEIPVSEKETNFQHASLVHKGLRFTIGKSDIYDELSNTEKENVGLLLSRKLAVLDVTENKAIITKIDEAATKEAEIRKQSLKKAPSLLDVIETLSKQNAELLAAVAKNGGGK